MKLAVPVAPGVAQHEITAADGAEWHGVGCWLSFIISDTVKLRRIW